METLRPVATSERDEQDLRVLLVDVDGVRCGLPMDDVVEVHSVVQTVPLPGAPAPVDGAIDVRGSVVAVLDLRARLGLTSREPVLTDHLVVARVGPRTVALRVDRAVDLTTVERSRIDAAGELSPGSRLLGVARLEGGLVLIHDLASFLSADEAAALDEALAGAGYDGAHS